MLTTIILTRDEELHIGRAIDSVSKLSQQILVVDSGSTDRTVEVARNAGAVVHFNKWKNYASQFNWAIEQLPKDTKWVLRLDADEVVCSELANQILQALPTIPEDVCGIIVNRRMTFLGKAIRHGGVFPVEVIRLFRYGNGQCENRWMDEHIKVAGKVEKLDGELLDDNLNSLSWWTEKHNRYSAREVVDILNQEFKFADIDTVASLTDGQQAGFKRWLKERVYARMPLGGRALIYFCYRFFIRLGFLDGREGIAFHVLQGFWYRYLVDAKLYETRKYMREKGADAPTAIRAVLGIEV